MQEMQFSMYTVRVQSAKLFSDSSRARDEIAEGLDIWSQNYDIRILRIELRSIWRVVLF